MPIYDHEVTQNFARSERAELCDLLVNVGPDQPTLCTGWTTRDLAAHLVIRERRPDAAAGIVVKSLAGHTERVRAKTAEQPFDRLISLVRHPPAWSLAGFGPADRVTNTTEFFIHHEDVRRALPDWTPRALPREFGEALHRQIKIVARLRLRRFPAKITINIPGYGEPLVAGAGGPELSVTGDPGELSLFLGGRQQVADVAVEGPEDLVARLRGARLGI